MKPNTRLFDVRWIDFRISRAWLGGEPSLGLLMGKHRLLRASYHRGPHPRGTSPLLTKSGRKLLLYMMVSLHLETLIQKALWHLLTDILYRSWVGHVWAEEVYLLTVVIYMF